MHVPEDINGLADGSYTFEVRAVDAVGNPDPSPAAADLRGRHSRPGRAHPDGPTQDPDNDDTPTWTFSGEPGSTFECKLEKDGSIVTDWTL